MLLLDATNAADYLRDRGQIERHECVTVYELSGGVSNIVLLVSRSDGSESFVLKQAREQLRVPDPWFCGVERIWREVETLKLAGDVLRVAPGAAEWPELPTFQVAVPRVLWEDREQFAFAMTDAPGQPWKAELMAGQCDLYAAFACGLLLGRLHAGTWHDPAVAQEFNERKFFEALRVDPYYRRVAVVHPDLSGPVGDLIDSMDREQHCLVHGDFSPKNLMLSRAEPQTITLIDCEVGHYGDPAFDLGFFLTHLVLKAIGPAREDFQAVLRLADMFLWAYHRKLCEVVGDESANGVLARGFAHLAGCLLARIDGKSRVDYLPQAERQEAVRCLARGLLAEQPREWQAVYSMVVRSIISTGPKASTSTITRVHSREVLDSRGRPTVEVELWAGDVSARAIVPSGASTGKAEALELRDGDPGRYDGRGVLKAVRNVNEVLGPRVLGEDPREHLVDIRLINPDDPRHTAYGANAVLGISLAAAKLAAALDGVPLYRWLLNEGIASSYEGCREAGVFQAQPTYDWPEAVEGAGIDKITPPAHPQLPAWSSTIPLPMVNMISGGLHAGGNLDFQDILVMPVGAPDYPTALEWIVRIYNPLRGVVTAAGYEGRLVGDEGGFGPRLKSNREAFELTVRAIERAKLRPGEDVQIALDAASTHFYDGTHYQFKATGKEQLTAAEMIEQYESLVRDFPLTSIEDGLAEDDWSGWQELTWRLGGKIQLVGDDLFATQPARIMRGIASRVANAALIKLNQVGTVSETLQAIGIAQAAGYRTVVSARSGETEDDSIADLAVGTRADQIKIGSIVRSERLAKYNRLLRIAEEFSG